MQVCRVIRHVSLFNKDYLLLLIVINKMVDSPGIDGFMKKPNQVADYLQAVLRNFVVWS